MSTEPALADLSAAVLARGGELRAGGTDTTARQRSGVSPGRSPTSTASATCAAARRCPAAACGSAR
ncbi:hypothetical protein WKI68_40155 [Streptomyces sp. MS1.HAVA.3]|uniref:Uncharacterized protein n=1 Tax=Streptomyces caledonius TaxID=3134107 RepID=A0ABU8UDP1_9ACTN